MTRLRDGRNIILFRFHNEPQVAQERIKILRHLNPGIPIYVLYGGNADNFETDITSLKGLVEGCWLYQQDQKAAWKWIHGDKMIKAWYRAVGDDIDFDFVFTYEYDLLIAKPLLDIYPNIDDDTLALSACTVLTDKIENWWRWTSEEPYRTSFKEFCEYLDANYGIKKQQKVCLGPGTLMPKKFLEAWDKVPARDDIHEELAYPAYAEALGFQAVDHGMHPGFFAELEEEKYFHCYRSWPNVTSEMIQEQLSLPNGRRAFHPVKHTVTLDELLAGLHEADEPVQSELVVS